MPEHGKITALAMINGVACFSEAKLNALDNTAFQAFGVNAAEGIVTTVAAKTQDEVTNAIEYLKLLRFALRQ